MRTRSSYAFGSVLAMIRDRLAVSELLPAAYAHYRPVIADCLHFFLERLSSDRLRRILSQQSQLPASTSEAERLIALLAHMPALHKLGQVVARDMRLTSGFRKSLERLESLTPLTPPTVVMELLRKEFSDLKKAGIALESEPLAEGSVAVVMPFTYHARNHPVRRGVFKLLKPGIEALLEEDLEILGHLGDFLDEECLRYRLHAVDYRDTFDTIRNLLAHEIHLDQEQEHLAEAAKIYEGMPSILIPSLFPFCSPRMTAMERVEGDKVADAHFKNGFLRDKLARTISEALIAGPMFSPQSAALFHADPHAGNLFLTSEGRVAILDWSLVGKLGKQERAEIAQLMLGAVTFDAERMERALVQLTQKKANEPLLREVLRASLRELHWTAFPGVVWLTRLLDQVVFRAGIRPTADLLLFRKTLLTLEGVLTALAKTAENAHRAMDEAVGWSFLRQWIIDWPNRFRKPFSSKSFGTHLSTADLLSLLWSTPVTIARWWGKTTQDRPWKFGAVR